MSPQEQHRSNMNISSVPKDLAVSDFHFRNCTTASDWLHQYLYANNLPIDLTDLFLRDGLHDYLARHPEVYISDEDPGLLFWFINNTVASRYKNETTLIENMVDFVGSHCEKDLCRDIRLEGFSDLTGRGVRIFWII